MKSTHQRRKNFWNGSRQAEGASPLSFRNDRLLRAQGWSQNPETGHWYRVIVGDVNGRIPNSSSPNALPPASLDRGSFDVGISRIKTRFISTSNGVTTDIQPTLDRITSGGEFPHVRDGSIFYNKEGLLPNNAAGYYREFVHPTPGVNGPGPMRIVTGQGGEIWFTPDHYKTFIPIR